MTISPVLFRATTPGIAAPHPRRERRSGILSIRDRMAAAFVARHAPKGVGFLIPYRGLTGTSAYPALR